MPRQSLVWTALPAGYTADGKGLRVSVHLAPRLDPQAGAPELKSFAPDWTDWPSALAVAKFSVRFGVQVVTIANGVTVGANRVDGTLGVADTTVWQALFTPSLPVRGFAFEDLSRARLISFDANTIAQGVTQLYGALGASATDDLPRISDFVDDNSWGSLIGAVSTLDRASFNGHSFLRDPALQLAQPSGTSDFAKLHSMSMPSELARFQLFHTPAAPGAPRKEVRTDDSRIWERWQEPRLANLPAKSDLAKTLDFHRIVAAMGSYPTLLRKLGLVIDLIVDAAAFTASPDAPLSVDVDLPAGHLAIPRSSDASPRVRTQLSATHFQPVDDPAADTHIVDGLLDLDPARYSLMQVDVDGAGLKLMNFLRSLGRRLEHVARVDSVTRHEDRTGAPALRSAGLALVQRGRAQTLGKRLQANLTRNAALESRFAGGGTTLDLHWQDVLRGWRIDIWDAMSGRWQSLCRRTARYELAGGAVVVTPLPEEEATVRMAGTRPADPAVSVDTLRLHETVVAWAGWSLAAPPPGRAVDPADGVDKTTAQSSAEVPPGLDFASTFRAVPGSLPRLRYGRAYWLRARAVDLAGSSLPPRNDDFGAERPKIRAQRYLRYEPVLPPSLALVAHGGVIDVPREGEAMDRIVIRSYNDTPENNAIPTTEVGRRAALPPRVSVREAEQHGMFDVGGGVDASVFHKLAYAKDVDPHDPMAVVRDIEVKVAGPFGATPTVNTFAVHEIGRGLTYLPDPLAHEVVVRVLNHPNISPSEVIDIPLYPDGTWPEARPFEIVVYDDSAERPYFDETARALRIPLPKGIRAQLRFSMKLDRPSLDLMGVFAWMNEAARTAQTPRALAGGHWMLTPWHTVEVMHAVQRPLAIPTIASLTVVRGIGDTAVQPVITADVSVKTTDRLDLLADWHEPAAGPMGEPRDVARAEAAFHVKVTAAGDYAARMSHPQAGGFPDHTLVADDVLGINVVQHDLLPKKAHELHDPRYRRIAYRLEATTRFREQLPHTLITREAGDTRVSDDAKIKVAGDAVVTWVPNAAPPPAPRILYVVPTFGWTRKREPGGLESIHRAGGGLRVYLDGPWHVSGYGEMLAVVLPPEKFKGDPDELPRAKAYKTYITQWGNDPAWESSFVRGLAPRRSDFPRSRNAPDPTGRWVPPNAPESERDQRPGAFQVTDLVPPGIRGIDGAVEIAPHDVLFDAERGLWYADIEIAPGATYFPFVRLALARYQPISVKGAHLSSVVLADFSALAPDRWLNVTPTDDGGARRVSVFGVGYDDSSGHVESKGAPSMSVLKPFGGGVEALTPAPVSPCSVIEIWIERLDERYGEDFGWQRVPSAVTRQDSEPAATSVSAATITNEGVAAVTSARRRVRELLATGDVVALARPEIIQAIRIWQTLWDGEIAVPETSARLRLVVAEFEEYLIDDAAPHDRVATRKDRRLVFVDHIALN